MSEVETNFIKTVSLVNIHSLSYFFYVHKYVLTKRVDCDIYYKTQVEENSLPL